LEIVKKMESRLFYGDGAVVDELGYITITGRTVMLNVSGLLFDCRKSQLIKKHPNSSIVA